MSSADGCLMTAAMGRVAGSNQHPPAIHSFGPSNAANPDCDTHRRQAHTHRRQAHLIAVNLLLRHCAPELQSLQPSKPTINGQEGGVLAPSWHRCQVWLSATRPSCTCSTAGSTARLVLKGWLLTEPASTPAPPCPTCSTTSSSSPFTVRWVSEKMSCGQQAQRYAAR